MTTVQTIQLDDSERLALQKALSVIDKVSDVAKVSANAVFNYFYEASNVNGDNYYIRAIHKIEDIR